MRRWRNTRWTDPKDLPDDWLEYYAERGCRTAPQGWNEDCFNEWGRRGFPRTESACEARGESR